MSEIESTIRFLKDKIRVLMRYIPYKSITRRMVIDMVKFTVLWLNALPENWGVSTTINPRGIIIGVTLGFRRHYKVEFGDYFQTH